MTNLEAALAIYDAFYGLDAHDNTHEEASEWAAEIGEEGAPLVKTTETVADWKANGWTVFAEKSGATILERKVGKVVRLACMADCGDYRLVYVD
jgi:hypothetical protein